MLIDCDSCIMQNTHHCRDCVVTAVVERPRSRDGKQREIVIDLDEERALRELAGVGLIPEIRMKRRNSS